MTRIAFAALVAVLLIPAPAEARRSYATSYCLQGQTASGAYVNRRTAAHNFFPFRTRVTIRPAFYGRHWFVVQDTGGALGDGHFDLWHPNCSASIAWGARSIRFRVGWTHKRF